MAGRCYSLWRGSVILVLMGEYDYTYSSSLAGQSALVPRRLISLSSKPSCPWWITSVGSSSQLSQSLGSGRGGPILTSSISMVLEKRSPLSLMEAEWFASSKEGGVGGSQFACMLLAVSL